MLDTRYPMPDDGVNDSSQIKRAGRETDAKAARVAASESGDEAQSIVEEILRLRLG